MPKLHRGANKLLQFLQGKKTGDIVSRASLLVAMGWKDSTLNTYITKNMITPFLIPLQGAHKFRVVKDGAAITPDDIVGSFSQVKPSTLQLAKSDVLQGSAGKYRLVKSLGSGAVAHVWQAIRESDKASLAVKIVNPRHDLLRPAVFPNVKRRFAREAANGVKLNHPCVVPIRDTGTFRKHPFLVMNQANTSIGAMLKSGVTFTESECKTIMRRVFEGLAYLHSQGCIHRDIKPDNLLQFASGVVIGDLGIVKWSDLNPAFTSAGTLTKDSIRLGSWFYMAPEQQRSPSKVTEAADVYSSGVTWYELLTGDHLAPADFASGQFADAPGSTGLNTLLRRLVVYRADDRPTVAEVLSDPALN